MLKPLLRTIPTMSGNVKLACNLLNYKVTDNNVYETDVRYAKLLPLSSTLYQKKIEAQLLGSSWEYDLRKFYDIYNDIFFDSYFKYNTEDILKIDKTSNQYLRNTDFEMGAKRISYVKNGMQFAFFAPFYFESIDDLPLYFNLDINIHTNVHSVKKRIVVNITRKKTSNTNYLYHYLTKYASNIDSNVCFMLPDSKQATYYGIDLINGGFVKAIDNGISNLYDIQTTIQNFDATICSGFKRNKIAMKQVMPLAFYLDVRDVMTKTELKLYRNAVIEFSGYYVSSNNIPLPWYDFNIDYDLWKESVLRLNTSNGIMQWMNGYVSNIMDVSFPSLNDVRYIKYQFSNKLTANYCRWKLKYSSDEHPYISNISPAFSKNQNSNYKYGQYPVSFSSMDGLALPIRDDMQRYYYNLIFPLSTNLYWYDIYNPNSSKKYVNIFDNYCLNWFNVIDDIDEKLFNNISLWKDVVDDCVYYNGILYDLSNIYSELVDPEKIDKFGVFVKINKKFMKENEVYELKFADYTLDRQVTKTNINPNALSNLQLLNWSIGSNAKYNYKNYLYNNEEYIGERQQRANRDAITFSNIFTYSETNTGHYIDFSDYGLDYYELNKYYDYNKTASYIEHIRDNFFDLYRNELVTAYGDNWDSSFESIIKEHAMSYMGVLNDPSSYMINSYELLPIGRSYDLSYFDGEYDANLKSYYMYSYGYSYMLNLYEYTAYEHKFDNDGTSYMSYYYKPIEGVKNIYGGVDISTTYEFEHVSTYLNVCNIDNYGVKKLSYTTWTNPVTLLSTSYFSSGKPEYVHSLYGNTFYNWRTFMKFAYINTMAYEPFDATYLKTFCDNGHRQDIFNYGWIYEPGNMTYKLWKSCQNVQAIAASAVLSYVANQTQYMFKPIIAHNDIIYSANSFVECFDNTGRFYGSKISYSQLSKDRDVIYADRYNLNAIFKKYTGLKTYTYYTSPLDAYTYNYAITYDFVYDINKSSYDTIYTKYTNAPEILTYEHNTNGDIIDVRFNSNDYSEFYAKFLNKEHIYYWYGELSKDEQLKQDKDWYLNWKEHIFIKRRVLVHTNDGLSVKDEYIPLVEAGYMFVKRVDQEWFLSFKKFYANIEMAYNSLFYFKGCPGEKFELVYRDIFFRVNKTLWDIIGCENEEYYKDLYLYRIEHADEYYNYNTNDVHMRYVGNDFYNSYTNYYHSPDSSLTPLFYNVFEREEQDEAIGANYQLNNISEVDFAWPEYDGSREHLIRWRFGKNYRYNANNSLYMVSITDDERERLNIDKTYEEYSYCSSNINVNCNSLNYNPSLKMSTYKDPNTNTNYGFYVIEVNVDNTSNSLRIDAQTTMSSKSIKEEVYDYINNIKHIFYINGVKITDNPEYFNIIFKNIAPFIKTNLLGNLNELNTIVKPNAFNINMIYSQQLVDNTNGSTEINLYKDKSIKYTKQNLYRYTHNIVPYITECNMLNNYYYLKLKNVDKTLLDTHKFNSIGDTVLYKKTIQTNMFMPHNVYTISDNEKEISSFNNVDYKYTPLEYKHFNASKFINIEPSIKISLDGKYLYDELIDLQTNEYTIKVFAGYMNAGRAVKFDSNEILFLYKKYRVEYDSKSVGLNYNHTQKLYTLTYIFSLL